MDVMLHVVSYYVINLAMKIQKGENALVCLSSCECNKILPVMHVTFWYD